MRRFVVSNVNRLSPKPSSELGNIRDSYMIKSPQHVLVERNRPLLQAYFYAIRKKFILSV